MRCFLVGNYGVDNWGDEALCERFLARYPWVDWAVITGGPTGEGRYARLPCGIRSFFAFRWVRTLRALQAMDAVVLGGGTLFTDIESPKACFLWWLHVVVPRIFGVPVFCAAQGIGPFRTRIGRMFAVHALRRCQFLSVRDPVSAAVAQSFGLSIEIVQTFDPVLLSIHAENSEGVKNMFIVIPRSNSTDSFRATALSMARAWDGPVRVLLFEPGVAERAWAEAFRADMGRQVTIVPVVTTRALIEACAGGAGMVTQRFHGAIAALALGIPCTRVAQNAGDKLSRLPDTGDAAALHALRTLAQEGESRLELGLRSLAAATGRRA